MCCRTKLSRLQRGFGVDTAGALMIRIGFWAYYAILIIRNPHNGIGNYLGPYVTFTKNGSLLA